MSVEEIVKKAEEYLACPSVVGYEDYFLKYLADDFSVLGYEVETSDGLLAVSSDRQNQDSKILTVHIDRHGIVADEYGKFSYAAFDAKKRHKIENVSIESVFKASGERFVGERVYAYDSSSGRKLSEGKVKGFNYNFDEKTLFFDIDGLDDLPFGTPIGYVSKLIVHDGLISSQIDNVISIAVAYQLAKDGFDGTILFSKEDEIGRSWKHVVSYLQQAGLDSGDIVNIDTTPYDDLSAVEKGLVVLRNKDENAVFDKSQVDSMKGICDGLDIEYEMKDEVIEDYNSSLPAGSEPKLLGKTELGRILQHTSEGFNGVTVQIPTIDYHSNHETTSELALENYYRLLKKVMC